MKSAPAFDELASAKTRDAEAARLHPLETLSVGPAAGELPQIGNAWTRTLYDGGFHLVPPPDQDICLTTTERSAGEADTPYYVGKQVLALTPLVTKRSTDPQAPFLFEHFAVTGRPQRTQKSTDEHAGSHRPFGEIAERAEDAQRAAERTS